MKFRAYRRFTVLMAIAVLGGCHGAAALKNRICFKNHCFDVEVVDKEETRNRGLQFRESMPANHGMLFIFPDSGVRSFWMKDTKIPLDMIWIDYSHHIVYIESNVPPCQADPCPVYTPSGPAMYVLELNAGTVRKIGLQPGDTFEFQLQQYLK